ncbi:MAG: hypothetical protein ACRDQG_13240, partial [Pseudonocardiaceae bacterium]
GDECPQGVVVVGAVLVVRGGGLGGHRVLLGGWGVGGTRPCLSALGGGPVGTAGVPGSSIRVGSRQ